MRKTVAIIATLMALIVRINLQAQAPAQYLNIPYANQTEIAIYIEDLTTGKVKVDVNSDRPMLPASVMKSLTSATLLSTVDTDEAYITEVKAEGRIAGGTLHGNLVVYAVGDPTIESAHFDDVSGFADSIAVNLRRLGIERIEGSVIIDQGVYGEATTPPGWKDSDIVWAYGATHGALNYRDNRMVLKMPSGTTTPKVPGLKISHTQKKRGRLNVKRKDGSLIIEATGKTRQRGESLTLSNPNPSATMRWEILSALDSMKISVDGKQIDGEGEKVSIYRHYSPSWYDILQSLMFRSDNMMAEGMLRLLSANGDRGEAVRAEMDVWSNRHISADGIAVVDGSGLSRQNRLTARFLADVYVWMVSGILSEDYVSLFPKAGVDGTVKNFLVGTPLEGRAALKSGSLQDVQSYAGFIVDEFGNPTHVVVVMVNGFKCKRQKLRQEIERRLNEAIPQR